MMCIILVILMLKFLTMNKVKIVVAFVILFTNTVFSQGRDDKESDKTDPLFASAFKKYEEKNFQGAYLDYTAFLAKFPLDVNAMLTGVCVHTNY
jgi:hypothetical protein